MSRFLSLLLAFGSLVSLASAQEVEVTAVRFSHPRSPGGATGNWLEAAVALNVRPPAGSPGQMVSRVRINLLVGFELPAQGGKERRIEHYRAEAECVALSAGRSDVRFYLPAELVKRDQLHGEPKYWGVEVSAGGKPQTAGRGAYAASLASTEQRKNFAAKGGASAAANDGILLPQYLTPFVSEYPRETPSFVRREVR